jgi:hypothetical protein
LKIQYGILDCGIMVFLKMVLSMEDCGIMDISRELGDKF